MPKNNPGAYKVSGNKSSGRKRKPTSRHKIGSTGRSTGGKPTNVKITRGTNKTTNRGRNPTSRHKIGPEGGSPIIRREQPRPGPSPSKRRKTPGFTPGIGAKLRATERAPKGIITPVAKEIPHPKRRKTRVRHPSVKPGLVRSKQAPKPGTTPTRRRGQLTPRRGRA